MGRKSSWLPILSAMIALFAVSACNGGETADSPVDLTTVRGSKEEPSPATSANAKQIYSFDLNQLVHACGEDNIVMGYGADGEIRQTGVDISGYCSGYLIGTYNAMKRAEVICSDNEHEEPSPYFLRSVFQQYLKGKETSRLSQFETVWNAYKDAFSCNR